MLDLPRAAPPPRSRGSERRILLLEGEKHMRHFTFVLVMVTVIATTLFASSTASAASQDSWQHDLVAVKSATARYHSMEQAKQAQYGILRDAAGIACIDNPGMGAMGIHYVNGALVGSGKIDALHPQALVYEPMADGRLSFVAVEYVTFQQQWDATHSAPPTLFGQDFMLVPAPNRFGLPAFYALHAWIWRDNPSGMFAMWNPQVSCAAAR
jgi:hypothetical protein